jgi:hypothetical protein
VATIEAGPQPQHLRALQHANRVRLARAELKRQIAIGNVSAASVILRTPWEAQTMTIAELLCTQRRWGATRTRKFLAEIGMPETKTLRSFTERQRALFAAMV